MNEHWGASWHTAPDLSAFLGNRKALSIKASLDGLPVRLIVEDGQLAVVLTLAQLTKLGLAVDGAPAKEASTSAPAGEPPRPVEHKLAGERERRLAQEEAAADAPGPAVKPPPAARAAVAPQQEAKPPRRQAPKKAAPPPEEEVEQAPPGESSLSEDILEMGRLSEVIRTLADSLEMGQSEVLDVLIENRARLRCVRAMPPDAAQHRITSAVQSYYSAR